MGTSRILPINNKPIIRNYTYHAFLQAIISSEQFIGQLCAEIEVDDFDQIDWKVLNDNLTHEIERNKISFAASKWMKGMNEVFYRKCLEDDTIVLTINKQIYTSVWGKIDLFLVKFL